MKSAQLGIGIIFALVLFSGIGWLIYKNTDSSQEIKASGTIQSTDIQLASRIGGRIQNILVAEGDFVKRHEPLVTLDPYQLPAKQAELQAQRTLEKAKLDELVKGPRYQEISKAKANYLAAQAHAHLMASGARQENIAQAEAALQKENVQFQQSKADYERYKTLYERHVISKQELERTKTQYHRSEANLNTVQQQLLELQRGNRPEEITKAQEKARAEQAQFDLLKSGTRTEQIQQQEARIAALDAQIEQLNKQFEETKIISPCECQINILDWKTGQLIAPNQTIASLVNLDDLWIRVYIPSERFGQMTLGDTVTLEVDAFPNETFSGKIIQLASKAEFTPRNIQTEEGRKILVFGIKISIDNTQHRLRPGMPADIIFQLNKTSRP